MGCSNTTNKKGKNIKAEKLNKNGQPNNSEGEKKDERTSIGQDLNGKSNINDDKDSGSPQEKISSTCISIRVDPSETEKMYNLWVEKNSRIKIIVKGKWCLFQEHGMVNYKGYTNLNYQHRNANIGALIARVHGGKYFSVNDGMTYISEVSGPLYFFANNSNFTLQPSGSLEVYIDNCKQKSYDEIQRLLEWNLSELDTARDCDYLTDEEKMQFIFLNKVRTNPKLFAKQYLIHLVENGPSYKEIYEKLNYFPTSRALQPSKALFLAARDHALDLGENASTGHTSSNGEDLITRISKYSDNPKYFGENCSFGAQDPLGIVIQMIVDDGYPSRGHRASILNEGFSQVGLSVKPHATYKWNCVQVFGSNIKDKQMI
jgi:hypothetical protein